MRPLGLHRDVCQLSKHVVLEGGKLSLCDERPGGTLWLGTVEDHGDPLCARTLLRLEGREIDLSPPSRYVAAYAALSATSHPEPASAWRIVDSARRLACARELLRDASARLGLASDEYHSATFVPETRVLRSLRPFRVDPALLETDDPAAPTFSPDADGWVRPPTYNRFGTRTGRLTVTEGPRVLTARQSSRELLRAIDGEHRLVSFDYSSLEARVALALAGIPALPTEDPYQVIAKAIRLKSREEAKNATFTAIYSDPTSSDRVDVKVTKVRRVFKLGETFAMLAAQREASGGKVRNLYGRLVEVTGNDTLYNNYVQSTGADAVLLGFLELLDPLLAMGVVPHFVLHDALFASVPRSRLEEASALALAGARAPRLDCVFPIKTTIVGESAIV